MIEIIVPMVREPRLMAAGLPPDRVRSFVDSLQYSHDAVSFEPDGRSTARVRTGQGIVANSSIEVNRTELNCWPATGVHLMADTARKFFRNHVGKVYRELTNNGASAMRIEQLAALAASRLPGLLPAADLAEERKRLQKDKDGLEISQGLFFSQILSDPVLRSSSDQKSIVAACEIHRPSRCIQA